MRQAIDRVNVEYEYPEEEEGVTEEIPTRQEAGKEVSVSQQEISRLREVTQEQQAQHIMQIHTLSLKVEQLSKALKLAEGKVDSQLNEIVGLEKENALLKDNLNGQYQSVVTWEEKERRLKEELHRINTTANELAIEINQERNHNKQLQGQLTLATQTIDSFEKSKREVRQDHEVVVAKLEAELEERKQMFEYHVKKAAEDRQEHKLRLANVQSEHE